MALSEYGLATLRFVYTSKLRKELLAQQGVSLFVEIPKSIEEHRTLWLRLNFTVSNLRRSLEWSKEPWPIPQRLPRRSWRVSYLKRPFRSKITIRCALSVPKEQAQQAVSKSKVCPALPCFVLRSLCVSRLSLPIYPARCEGSS